MLLISIGLAHVSSALLCRVGNILYSSAPSSQAWHLKRTSPSTMNSLHPPLKKGIAIQISSVPSSTRSIETPPLGRPKLFLPRTALLIVGPLFLTAVYALIAVFYLWDVAENDVVSDRPINATVVFYVWFILSIFLLEWTKNALAGFEAAVLMRARTDVNEAEDRKRREQILAWHADRAWGHFGAWGKAILKLGKFVIKKLRRDKEVEWDGPGPLWWYLALMVFLFAAIIPLSGLSMNPADAVSASRRPVLVLGPNETTFDILTSNEAVEQASNRWRTQTVTTPDEPTIFYAPEGVANVSTTWFEDQIQADFKARTKISMDQRTSMKNRTVSFFSGPKVAKRAYGRAWGLLTNLSCMPVHPYKHLRLLNVSGINNWTGLDGTTSREYERPSVQYSAGFSPVHSNNGNTFGLDWRYVIATDGPVGYVAASYGNASLLPSNGTIELVLWQGYSDESFQDPGFLAMSKHPFVVNSSSSGNVTSASAPYSLGLGVRCRVNTTVGTASLSASKRTYSNFRTVESNLIHGGDGASNNLFEYPGVLALESLVFHAFTTLTPGYMGAPKCDTPSILCGPWIGANRATGGTPLFNPRDTSSSKGGTMQYPTLDPERMNLAMYKLFGETAIVVMSSTPGAWTLTPNASAPDPDLKLYGLSDVSDLRVGIVPPIVVLVALGVWSIAMIGPPLTVGMLWKRREVELVGGRLLYGFGVDKGRELGVKTLQRNWI